MGISGLLPFLKKATRPCHVREMAHATVAVDAYCWLHKGAFGCADKLGRGQNTDGYLVYIMKLVDMLLSHNINPVLVFDGRNLPMKAVTEKKRRESKERYRRMAKEHDREGRARESLECYRRCVEITPEMASSVIRACHQRNVDCIVAPHEADAQLAYLALSGHVEYVISEDSDLTLFGCQKIIFKLDSNGNGLLYEKDKLNLCFGNLANNFNFEKFRYMCIMSGCDYLNSFTGIGLGKSFKFWSLITNPNVSHVLKKIPSYLNMPQITVTQDYVNDFIRANNTFLYQIVFDPKSRTQKPLNAYPDADLGDLSYAGARLDDDVALQFSLGNLNFHTLCKVDNFDPDVPPPNGVRQGHRSIWSSSDAKWSKPKDSDRAVVHTAFGDIKCKESQNDQKSVHTEDKDLKSSFGFRNGDIPTKIKRKPDDADQTENLSQDNDILSQYAKRAKPSSTVSSEAVPETKPATTKVYVSKYFANKTTPSPFSSSTVPRLLPGKGVSGLLKSNVLKQRSVLDLLNKQ